MDLTTGYQQALSVAEAKAKSLLASEDWLGASGEYARCAHLVQQLANSARSSNLKESRLNRAKRFSELSVQLKNRPLIRDVEKNNRSNVQIDNAPDDLLSRVRGLVHQGGVRWDQIAGLDDVKSQIRSLFAIALAQKPAGMVIDERPNILLYGPPGTGKTLLASAAAQGLDATFYSVKSGDLLSKFFGESPQLVGKLFKEAKNTSPSVVFLDEVEALSPDRDGPGGVSGPESRLLSQLLAELDGIDTKTASELVITIAATNKPWLLDDAALSRFSRLVYVGLPDGSARQDMFELGIEKAGFETEVPMSTLSEQTQNYSGREISTGCREAIRTMLARANPDLESMVDQGVDAVREYQLKKLPISQGEIDQALAGVRFATGPEELAQYEAWKDGR